MYIHLAKLGEQPWLFIEDKILEVKSLWQKLILTKEHSPSAKYYSRQDFGKLQPVGQIS